MATAANTATPDSLITIKLQIGQENRRCKLPLKELIPTILPAKLRAFLAVPATKIVIFQRYSDSAACFVTLNDLVPGVYKQLYRAAKAKLKLRIKVTILDPEMAMAAGEPAPESVKEDLPPPVQQESAGSLLPSLTPQPMRLADLLSDSPPSAIPTVTTPAAPKPFSSPQEAQAQLQTSREKMDGQQQSQAAPMRNVAEKLTRPDVPRQPWYPTEAEIAAKFRECLREAERKVRTNDPRTFPDGFHHRFSATDRQLPDGDSRNSNPSAGVAKSNPSDQVGAWQPREWYDEVKKSAAALERSRAPFAYFSVCCNKCNVDIPGAHWHCSICQEGDYDLCQGCVENGNHCHIDSHFLIKRVIENGRVINSTMLTLPKRTKSDADVEDKKDEKTAEEKQKPEEVVPGAFTDVKEEAAPEPASVRTCNRCVNVFEESNFVTCLDCDDYDLCIPCHVGLKHGHHPAHAFEIVAGEKNVNKKAEALCAPGRKVHHFALCDGCDKDISGIRHKCLNCPDWDYCSTCVKSASLIHPGHRFVPIYETIPLPSSRQPTHHGIRCDGMLCKVKSRKTFITGDRYKCAVCHDTDFCASCEALPTNAHNRTHPLIKIRSPIRHVSVTTYGEGDDGTTVATMGDHMQQTNPKPTESKSTETTPAAPLANAATQVQTVAEFKPIEAVKEAAKIESSRASPAFKYEAQFVKDSVRDGTKFAPSELFDQVWTVRNPGPLAWPAGCSLRFVGGDRMLNIDMENPGSITDLDKADSSNVIRDTVPVGGEVDFAVTLKAPRRSGRAISYWRTKTADGVPFGYKLWCEIDVVKEESKTPAPLAGPNEDSQALLDAKDEQIASLKNGINSLMAEMASVKEQGKTANEVLKNYLMTVDNRNADLPPVTKAESLEIKGESQDEVRQSQMIFPTLDKESPESSMHEHAAELTDGDYGLVEEVEGLDLEDNVDVDDASTDAGFLTDEDYEILDMEYDGLP